MKKSLEFGASSSAVLTPSFQRHPNTEEYSATRKRLKARRDDKDGDGLDGTLR